MTSRSPLIVTFREAVVVNIPEIKGVSVRVISIYNLPLVLF